jgi:pyruvate dehydrogenase E2 component (dihydrolipoamide acetyltransferase)
MAFEVILPRQGQSVETCLILEWQTAVGQAVREGDPLCRVETDKAVFDIEAPRGGTLLKIYYREGEDVPVLSRLALLGEPDEDVSAWEAGEAAAAGPPAAPAAPAASAAPAAPAAPAAGAAARAPGADEPPRRTGAVSPRARRLAARLGVDAAAIAGSGPGGRVIERDVRRRAAERQPLTPAALARLEGAAGTLAPPAGGGGIGGRIRAEDLLPLTDDGPYTDLPLTPTRRRIAERLLASLNDSAQYTLHAWADAERLLAAREALRSGAEGITLNDLILYITARVLQRFPELNSHFLGDRVRRFGEVHLGFAVDTDRGLLVPVIRGAGRLGPEEISREAGRLAAACRESRATPGELSGGTFTVSNLGGLGVESFTPVLNPPQVGILGVGRVGLRPVETEAGVRFVHSLPLSLTVNHQVLDGVPAARFLAGLSAAIAAFQHPQQIDKKERS